MAHNVHWYSPAPLWAKRLENGSRERLTTPELLRFTTDDFMTVLQKELQGGATTFADHRAGTETNRTKHTTDSSSEPIPLYQPVHERYYLVTSSLVCRERGLPDRMVDTASDESASFVLRRCVQEESEEGQPETREYRWFGDEWRPIKDDPRHIPDGEERLPMFPQTYTPETPLDGQKGRRRLWAGLIPVAKRETYETAPIQQGGAGNGAPPPSDDVEDEDVSLADPRKTTLNTRIIGAFSQLRELLKEDASKRDPSLSPEDVRDPLLFAWLDLWEFLNAHLSGVAQRIRNPDRDSGLTDEGQDVYRQLEETDFSGTVLGETLGENAVDVLRKIQRNAKTIEAGQLDEVLLARDLLSPGENGDGEENEEKEFDRGALADELSKLLDADSGKKALQKVITGALEPLESTEQLPDELTPPMTDAPVAPDDGTDGWTYVVRCVYERPQCPPSKRTEVSKPSRPFRMASFFDADAPARELSITLPGASVAELRNSSQSVTMHFTEELRKQAQRVQDLSIGALEEGDIGSAPGVNIGMICSLSIPIITICALILLLIIVTLLNIVFWWLPFFKICFPLPSGE